jgi:hypothetical protein
MTYEASFLSNTSMYKNRVAEFKRLLLSDLFLFTMSTRLETPMATSQSHL